MVLASGVENVVIEHQAQTLTQSAIFDNMELEDL
jgi:hypothetical protein